MKILSPARHLNPSAPKICFLDIDGVVCEHGNPFELRSGIVEKLQLLNDQGWQIIAFTTRSKDSLEPLIQQGLQLAGYILKPMASEIMIIDDILSEAHNQL